MIDEPGGGKRPLGIPAIKDRVAELAAVLVLEPIGLILSGANNRGHRRCLGLPTATADWTCQPRSNEFPVHADVNRVGLNWLTSAR